MTTATQQKTVTYLADGTKAIDTTIENGAAKYSAKLGSLIYEFENNQEKFSVLTDGGIIVWNYSTGQKETLQYIKDHLGNVRVILQNGRPAAFNEYEPFGRFEQEYSYNKFQNVTLPEAKNKFLFNGKEEMLGRDIGMLDFGARIYDPTIARWNSLDPKANRDVYYSPYAYCRNSPIVFIDPKGEIISGKLSGAIAEFMDQFAKDHNLSISLDPTKWGSLSNQQILFVFIFLTMGITLLQNSEMVYDLVISDELSKKFNSDLNVGAARFNKNNGHIELVIPTLDDIGLFAHELTHMIQFELGKISYEADDTQLCKNPFYDLQDELEAYYIGSFFGQAPPDWGKYETIKNRTTQQSTYNNPAFKNSSKQSIAGYANNQNIVFKYNGDIYMPKQIKEQLERQKQ